jgi:hypothetical protein
MKALRGSMQDLQAHSVAADIAARGASPRSRGELCLADVPLWPDFTRRGSATRSDSGVIDVVRQVRS